MPNNPQAQADGLDHWARVLEVHKPKSSAAGILMLHAAAKTIRAQSHAVSLVVKTLVQELTIEDLNYICEDLGDYKNTRERLYQKLLRTD